MPACLTAFSGPERERNDDAEGEVVWRWIEVRVLLPCRCYKYSQPSCLITIYNQQCSAEECWIYSLWRRRRRGSYQTSRHHHAHCAITLNHAVWGMLINWKNTWDGGRWKQCWEGIPIHSSASRGAAGCLYPLLLLLLELVVNSLTLMLLAATLANTR